MRQNGHGGHGEPASSRNYKPLELVGAQGVGTGGSQSTCDLYGLNRRLLGGSGQC